MRTVSFCLEKNQYFYIQCEDRSKHDIYDTIRTYNNNIHKWRLFRWKIIDYYLCVQKLKKIIMNVIAKIKYETYKQNLPFKMKKIKSNKPKTKIKMLYNDVIQCDSTY